MLPIMFTEAPLSHRVERVTSMQAAHELGVDSPNLLVHLCEALRHVKIVLVVQGYDFTESVADQIVLQSLDQRPDEVRLVCVEQTKARVVAAARFAEFLEDKVHAPTTVYIQT